MNIGDIIKNIETFLEGLSQAISTAFWAGNFATKSAIVVALFFGVIATLWLVRVILIWQTPGPLEGKVILEDIKENYFLSESEVENEHW